MVYQSYIAFIIFSLLSLSQSTKIFYRSIDTNKDANSGVLCEYNFIPESSSFMISNVDSDIPNGEYCLSTGSNTADCFQLININEHSDYKVVINHRDPKKVAIKEFNKGNGNYTLFADMATNIKTPNTPLDPLKKKTKKYEDIKKEKKGTTSSMKKNNIIQREKIEFEDEVKEEKEPSFLVKNWRYIVIGFLIFKLISTKDEKKEKKE